MTLSLRARFWRFLLRKIFKKRRLTIAQHRLNGEKVPAFFRLPPHVRLEQTVVAGRPAAWIRPQGANPRRVLLHLHGGGYVTGSISSHLSLCVPLAQTLEMNLMLPEYRLAPEHPFPAALEDALAIYRFLLAQEAQSIFVSGDSAGGGLALALTLALREAGDPLPAAVICLSPWTDLTFQGTSHLTRAKSEVVLTTETLKEWAACYAATAERTHPLISPIYADFLGFPPLLIQVGSHEILLDDARIVAEKARAAGVQVQFRIWDGLWHVWPLLGSLIPESQMAFDEIKEFIFPPTDHPNHS
jgi:acetyl esterase/lipase